MTHTLPLKAASQKHLPIISKSTVKVFTVVSQALCRCGLTPSQLVSTMDSIKEFMKGIKDKKEESYSSVPVGTVDSWKVIVDRYSTSAIQSAEFVFPNASSYKQGQRMRSASYFFFDDIMQTLQTIQTVKGSTGISFLVCETE